MFCFLIAQNSSAADRKGIQIVGLSKMSKQSATNCASAIKQSRISTFEFAYMPFFNASNPFNNVGTLLDIQGVSKVETIYLSWREESSMTGSWDNASNVLKSRAQAVNTHINSVRGRVEKIILVPMLEDNWSSDRWLTVAKSIANQLDSGSKVYFRRCPVSSSSTAPSSFTAKLKNGSNYTFDSIRLELHQINHSSSAQVISNDGGFVYQNISIGGKYESSASFPNAPGGYTTLANWTADANKSSKVSNLWRPSYNLIRRDNSKSLIMYYKEKTLDQRTDSDSNPAFNSFEMEVLKTFLK